MNGAQRFRTILEKLADLDCGVPRDGDHYMIAIRQGEGHRLVTIGALASLARTVRASRTQPRENGHA